MPLDIVPIFDQHGNPILTSTQYRTIQPDADGVRRVYDHEGYGVHESCIPAAVLTIEPDPEDAAEAARILDAAARDRVIRLALAVVAAGHEACARDQAIPPCLDHAIGELDVAIRALPCTDDEEPIIVEPHPDDPDYRQFIDDDQAMYLGRVMAIG